jgi:hypothetical protein
MILSQNWTGRNCSGSLEKQQEIGWIYATEKKGIGLMRLGELVAYGNQTRGLE